MPVDDRDLICTRARWEDCGQVKVVVKVESLDEMLLIQVCVCARARACTRNAHCVFDRESEKGREGVREREGGSERERKRGGER